MLTLFPRVAYDVRGVLDTDFTKSIRPHPKANVSVGPLGALLAHHSGSKRHIMTNTALTGATSDIDGGLQFVAAYLKEPV